jgi:hypothetical protein
LLNIHWVRNVYSLVVVYSYFSTITAVGYYIMKDEKWLSPALGGSGAIVESFYTLDIPPTATVKYYTLVQLGYHFHSLVYMLLLTPIRNDFLEMMVHHVATIFLIGCSYLSNYWAPGALVAFVHDIGDVTGCKWLTLYDWNILFVGI